MSRKAKPVRKAALGGVTDVPGKSAAAVARLRWTGAGAARAARDARIATVAHLRGAAVAQQWEVSKLVAAYQILRSHLGAEVRVPRLLPKGRFLDESAWAMLFGGAGLTPPFPATVDEGARAVLDRRADDLDAATLYVLSPPMCDVVVAAAQTLSLDDIALLDHDDLPSPTGMLMLPHPILVRAVNGSLGDNRAYVWTTPADVPGFTTAPKRTPLRAGVRFTTYHDAHGPVQPDSFRDMAAVAAAQRTPLPPLVPDATQTFPFRPRVTDRHREAAGHLAEHARAAADAGRELHESAGVHEGDQVAASFDYQPGDEVDDRDDLFTLRFLYAFWRLCEQDIVDLDDAPIGHSAQVLADRAGSPRKCGWPPSAPPAGPARRYRPGVGFGNTSGWSACTRSASGTRPRTGTKSSTGAPTSKARPTSRCSAATSSGASTDKGRLFLASRGSRVRLVVRAAELGIEMSSYLATRVLVDSRIEVHVRTEVVGVGGDDHLESIVLANTAAGTRETVPCAGLFCFIGAVPATSWLEGVLLDRSGFILTDTDLPEWQPRDSFGLLGRQPLAFETSMPGLFAVGDVRHGSMKRIAAAVGEGSSAIRSVHQAIGT